MDDDPQTLGARLRAKGIQLGEGSTPTRSRKVDHNKPHYNAWERGHATDDRGMPYLDGDLNPIGLKRFRDEGFAAKAAELKARNADARVTSPAPIEE